MEYGTWYCKIGTEPKLKKLTFSSIIDCTHNLNNWVSVYEEKRNWYGKLIKVFEYYKMEDIQQVVQC